MFWSIFICSSNKIANLKQRVYYATGLNTSVKFASRICKESSAKRWVIYRPTKPFALFLILNTQWVAIFFGSGQATFERPDHLLLYRHDLFLYCNSPDPIVGTNYSFLILQRFMNENMWSVCNFLQCCRTIVPVRFLRLQIVPTSIWIGVDLFSGIS